MAGERKLARSPGERLERAHYRQYVAAFEAKLLRDGKSKNTISSYCRDVGEFLSFLEAKSAPRVDSIDEQLIASFIAGLAGRDLGARSKAKKLTSLRSFMAWARREGLLESVPRKLTFPRVKELMQPSRARATG